MQNKNIEKASVVAAPLAVVLHQALQKIKSFVGDVPVYFGIGIPSIPVAVVCKYDISPTGDLSVRYRKFRFGSQIHRGFISYQLH